jgi:Fic family protein
MNYGDYHYVWQSPQWPAWHYDLARLSPLLAQVSRAQGVLAGRMAEVGLSVRNEACLVSLTADVLNTSEIEGELLHPQSVRSSIARRLGVDVGALAPVDRHIEGVVDMVMDATTRYVEPLSRERLFAWHAALFPAGYSGLVTIRVAKWREDALGPMQVVSGPIGRQTVHFEAPPAPQLELEMHRFLEWANRTSTEPAIIKAGIAHLWFVTVHPFDDGNGRIARAIGDLFLARADASSQRFYSLSAQIQRDRKRYYDVLEATQKGDLDISEWLKWFLEVLLEAVGTAERQIDAVLAKWRFWQRWGQGACNPRQVRLLNRMLDGFEGNMTSKKWAAIAKCSPDTALRDINDLLEKGVLLKAPGGGRSAAYALSANTKPD